MKLRTKPRVSEPPAVKRPGPLVEVEWMDTLTTIGWQDDHDLQELLAGEPGWPCITVGYLITQGPDRIVLCSTASAGLGKSEVTVIPRGCVKRINRPQSH